MKRFILKYYLILCSSVLGMLLTGSIAHAQDTLYFQKGYKAFHANSSITTSAIDWIVDAQDTVKADSLSRNWATGIYNLEVIPYSNGCPGESKFKILKAKDDVTEGDGQVHFSQELVSVCPSVDVKPMTNYVEVPVYFDGYVLKDKETYLFKYRIDNGPVQSSFPDSKYNGILTVDIQGLSVGTHYVRITMLYYKEGYSYQVDYSTSAKAPTMKIDISEVPNIGDINFEK